MTPSGPLLVDPSSYVDPHGFVFRENDTVFRAIYDDSADFYRQLIASKLADRLTSQFGLVGTEISERSLPGLGCGLVLKHDEIAPATYPVEWCPSMLHDAARLHLELALELSAHGMMLQDAYPWNVRFAGTRPVFIDFTSIVRADPRALWPAYGQFQSFFLRPLALSAMQNGKVARALLFDNINGIDLEDFWRNTTVGYRLRHPGLVVARALERFLHSHGELEGAVRTLSGQHSVEVSAGVRTRFLRGLLHRLDRIRMNGAADAWTEYYGDIPGDAKTGVKAAVVGRLLDRIRPSTVVDMGCNTGLFSMLAAQSGARVIALDRSEACLEQVYARAKRNNGHVQALVCDVLSPTPAHGFLGRQYPPLTERIRSETALCLGLMHHLYVTGRQSCERIASLLSELCTRAAIVEYVDFHDPNVTRLNPTQRPAYDLSRFQEALSQHFSHLHVYESDRPTRRILLCEKS